MQPITRKTAMTLAIALVAVATVWLATQPTENPPSMEISHQAFLTSYTWWDNTPPGSSAIAFAKEYGFPTLHNEAAGTGTWEDPITLAVGHVIEGATSTPDFTPGKRFYIPNVRRYFIVEDLCGDGAMPQNIPCHNLATPGNEAPEGADVWLDLWMDGRDGTPEAVEACAHALTEVFTVIQNPDPDYVVEPGALFSNGTCAEQFGNDVLKK